MKMILALLGLLATLAGFIGCTSAFVYVGIFWFRADLFQVFVLLITGFGALGFWNAFDWILSSSTPSADTCLRDRTGGR